MPHSYIHIKKPEITFASVFVAMSDSNLPLGMNVTAQNNDSDTQPAQTNETNTSANSTPGFEMVLENATLDNDPFDYEEARLVLRDIRALMYQAAGRTDSHQTVEEDDPFEDDETHPVLGDTAVQSVTIPEKATTNKKDSENTFDLPMVDVTAQNNESDTQSAKNNKTNFSSNPIIKFEDKTFDNDEGRPVLGHTRVHKVTITDQAITNRTDRNQIVEETQGSSRSKANRMARIFDLDEKMINTINPPVLKRKDSSTVARRVPPKKYHSALDCWSEPGITQKEYETRPMAPRE